MEVTLTKYEELYAAEIAKGDSKLYEAAKEQILREKQTELEKAGEQQPQAVITKSDFIKMKPWEQAELLRDHPGIMEQFKKEVLA